MAMVESYYAVTRQSAIESESRCGVDQAARQPNDRQTDSCVFLVSCLATFVT